MVKLKLHALYSDLTVVYTLIYLSTVIRRRIPFCCWHMHITISV